MAEPMKTVSFKLPVQLDEALTAIARERNASRSALVREAIETLAKSERRSVTARVDEVIEGIVGPADLSSNPKQMTEYGNVGSYYGSHRRAIPTIMPE